MAWEKSYQLIGWKNKNEMLTTPLGATLLNRIDDALNEIDNRVIELNKQKAEAGDLDNMITNVSYNKETGVITFTKYIGSVQSFDLSEYISNIEVLVNKASASVTTASQKASEASASATSASKSAASAKEDADRAELAAKNAEAVSGVGIATETIAGLMAGGDNAVSEDGTLMLTKVTTDRTLYKSKAGGLKINSIEGESQQPQFSGKNLLKNATTTTTSNGITFTVNEDGSVTVSGTATATATFIIGYMSVASIGVGNYIFAGNYTNSYITTSVDLNLNNVWKETRGIDGRSFEISDGDVETGYTFTFYIRVNKGKTVNNTTVYPMLRSADITDDTYEPYVGGIPSPNPDYPQSIDSVVLSEIKGVGKNLLKNTAISKTENGITFTVNNDGSVKVNGTATATANITVSSGLLLDDYFKVGKYIYSVPETVTDLYSNLIILSGSTRIRTIYCYGTDVSFDILEEYIGKGYTIEANIVVGANVKTSNLTLYPMIRSADVTDSTWVPFQEKSIQLSNPITLRGIGDVKDTIIKQDGVYGVLRKVGKYIIDGTEAWTKNSASSSDYTYYFFKSTEGLIIKSNNGYCSHFKVVNTSSGFDNAILMYNSAYSNTLYLGASAIGLETNTTSALKAWLAENNVEIMYELETPTFEPLPLADQIALHQLETFDTVTYISTDSEIEPVIEVEYGTSKVGAYALKGMNDVEVEKLTPPVTNLLATIAGKPLDATMAPVLVEMINESKEEMFSALEWKLLNTVTGSTVVSLADIEFNELNVVVEWTTKSEIYPFYIPKSDLTTAERMYMNGKVSFDGSNVPYATEIRVTASLTQVSNSLSMANNASWTRAGITDECTTKVYYR